jgi:hypothetical protein
MDWKEVRFRAGQEIHKRRDLLMHRLGMRPGTILLNADWGVRQGQFFFFDSEIPERAE